MSLFQVHQIIQATPKEAVYFVEDPEEPHPVPSQASAAASADRAQLISDLQTVHDSAAKSLEAMGINACEVFLQNKVDTALAKAGLVIPSAVSAIRN